MRAEALRYGLVEFWKSRSIEGKMVGMNFKKPEITAGWVSVIPSVVNRYGHLLLQDFYESDLLPIKSSTREKGQFVHINCGDLGRSKGKNVQARNEFKWVQQFFSFLHILLHRKGQRLWWRPVSMDQARWIDELTEAKHCVVLNTAFT